VTRPRAQGQLGKPVRLPGAWRILPLAILGLSLLGGAPAVRGQGLGMAPVPLAAIPVVSLGGGAITTVVLAMDIAEERRTHPAVRNIGLGLGITNLVLGGLGITATALTGPGDLAPVAYAVSGLFLALGVTGGGLALAADTYDPRPRGPAPRPSPELTTPASLGTSNTWRGLGIAWRSSFP
jgi:hypothetical protein